MKGRELGMAERSSELWYSRGTAASLIAVLFLIVQSISILIPPFQSPDEFAHLKRAYLLSTGDVFLDQRNGFTGGEIDTGLLAYMDIFASRRWFPYEADPGTQRDPYVTLGNQIQWSGQRFFSIVPSVAAYFPLPYLPQALAFWLGEHSGISVRNTYYLARLFSLIAALGLLWGAFLLYPVPPFVLSIFIMPMTIAQLGSPTLDAVSFASCALVASLFMRGTDKSFSFTPTMHAALLLGIFSLATSRINLLALTPLPAAIYVVRRSRYYLMSTAVVIGVSLSWIIWVFSNVRGDRQQDGPTTIAATKYYLTHPIDLVAVLFKTVTNADLIQSYWYMFIGVFGWAGVTTSGDKFLRRHGVFLDLGVYAICGILPLVLAFMLFQHNRARVMSAGNLSLALASIVSLLLIFAIILVAALDYPAGIVNGVQGRYFIPVSILLGYSLFSQKPSALKIKLSLFILFILSAVSVTGMTQALLHGFWITQPVTSH